jgi:hypothetical protein
VAAPSFAIAEVVGWPIWHLLARLIQIGEAGGSSMRKCLVEMLQCAGFVQAGIVSRMTIVSRRVPSLRVDHIVAHTEIE